MLEFFVMLGMLIVLTAITAYRKSIVLGLALIVMALGLIFKVDSFEWTYKGWFECGIAMMACFGLFAVINSARNTEG